MPYCICDYDVDDDVCPLLLFVHYFSHCFLQSFIKCPIFGHWSVLTENQIDKGHIHTHTHMFTSSMRLAYVCSILNTVCGHIHLDPPPPTYFSLSHTLELFIFYFPTNQKLFIFQNGWINLAVLCDFHEETPVCKVQSTKSSSTQIFAWSFHANSTNSLIS